MGAFPRGSVVKTRGDDLCGRGDTSTSQESHPLKGSLCVSLYERACPSIYSSLTGNFPREVGTTWVASRTSDVQASYIQYFVMCLLGILRTVFSHAPGQGAQSVMCFGSCGASAMMRYSSMRIEEFPQVAFFADLGLETKGAEKSRGGLGFLCTFLESSPESHFPCFALGQVTGPVVVVVGSHSRSVS